MMVDSKANTLVITLTVRGLNDPIKWRHDHFVQKKKKKIKAWFYAAFKKPF